MSNVIYSNARARAKSNNLLGTSRLKRMLEGTPEEALKILSEVNFGEGVYTSSPLEFEKILYSEEKSLLNFIREASPSCAFSDYFLTPYDYHNAEVFLKCKYLKLDPEKMLVCHGKIESGVMGEKIMVDDYGIFDGVLRKALLSSDSLFVSGNATGEKISRIIKKALYERLYDISNGDKILKEIFSFKADATNISTVFRTKDFDKAKEIFVKGGNISLSDLKDFSLLSVEELKGKIKFFKHGEIFSLALKSYESGLPLSEFEKKVESFSVNLLNKNKYATDSYLPFVLYCYDKLAEIKNVRIIMVGLINGQPKNEIERRLRDSYEG